MIEIIPLWLGRWAHRIWSRDRKTTLEIEGCDFVRVGPTSSKAGSRPVSICWVCSLLFSRFGLWRENEKGKKAAFLWVRKWFGRENSTQLWHMVPVCRNRTNLYVITSPGPPVLYRPCSSEKPGLNIRTEDPDHLLFEFQWWEKWLISIFLHAVRGKHVLSNGHRWSSKLPAYAPSPQSSSQLCFFLLKV